MPNQPGFYDPSIWAKIQPGLRQYEATTGRQVGPQAMQGLFRAQADIQAQRGFAERSYRSQLALEQQRLQLAQNAQDTNFGGMAVSGVTQLGTSAATLGLLYKGGLFSSPAAASGTLPAASTTLPVGGTVGPVAGAFSSPAGSFFPASSAVAPAGTVAGAGTSGLTTAASAAAPFVASAGLGFGAGYGLSKAVPGASGTQKGLLGGAGGALVGGVLGSLLLPGIGTLAGAAIGGAGGAGGGIVGGKK